jgi:hypothetical protein
MGRSRRKQLCDYPQISGHEQAIIVALRAWVRPGMTLPTMENLGNFQMKTAKLALRSMVLDPNIDPAAREPARAALRVLKDIYHPNGRVGGGPYHGQASGDCSKDHNQHR